MSKQLVLISIILAVFFLNSCAPAIYVAGGTALGCGAYEEVGPKDNNAPCPVIAEIDKTVEKSWELQWPWADKK